MMQPHRTSTVERLLHHLAQDGIVALVIAVAALIQLRGLTIGIIMVFGLPPLYAALCTRASRSRKAQWAGWAFLGLIGIGSIIAQVPKIFPNLKGANLELGRFHDRLFTWYAAVYLIWLTGVPIYLFVASLRAHRLGLPARFSRFTCYLGLIVLGLFWTGFPRLLWKFGFWPVI